MKRPQNRKNLKTRQRNAQNEVSPTSSPFYNDKSEPIKKKRTIRNSENSGKPKKQLILINSKLNPVAKYLLIKCHSKFEFCDLHADSRLVESI